MARVSLNRPTVCLICGIESSQFNPGIILSDAESCYSSLCMWCLCLVLVLNSVVRYYTRVDAENAMRFINGTRLDDRIIRTDWDAGFKEGRQYGRGKSGGQVSLGGF